MIFQTKGIGTSVPLHMICKQLGMVGNVVRNETDQGHQYGHIVACCTTPWLLFTWTAV